MTKPTLHLVYPHGPRISCPDAIGRNLARRLAADYTIRAYAWDDRGTIQPAPGDLLLGHPHPAPRTIFRNSLRRRGWRRTIMLCPFAHGDLRQVAAWDTVLPQCDHYLAITGNHWMRTLPQSPYAHWMPRMTQVDLAVDRGDFPPVKDAFNPPGRRRILYIGSTVWLKNTGYLSEIARRMPDTPFSWIGSGRRPIRGLRACGHVDFSTEAARRLVAEHDFIIAVGFSDANPTVILEGMAWGLIPVCTPQSGYEGHPGIPNLPLRDAARAAAILGELQHCPEARLRDLQRANWKALDEHFNWDRFARQVADELRATGRPAWTPAPLPGRLLLRAAAAVSPYAPWHPMSIARRAARRLRVLRGDGGGPGA